MPEYQAPGVYVEEVDTGAMPIEGVGTSTAGFIGPTVRGPVDPTDAGRMTTRDEFERKFGSVTASTYLPDAVKGFFANGGSACYVARVAATDATASTAELDPPTGTDPVATVSAIGPGTWGSNVVLVVDRASSDRSSPPERFKLTVRYWQDLPVEAQHGVPRPKPRPAVEEVYDELTATRGDERFYESVINETSDLITIEQEAADAMPDTGDAGGPVVKTLGSASDGSAIGQTDYQGGTATVDGETTRTGLAALTAIDDVSLVCAPDQQTVDGGVRGDVRSHCENLGDRFAILQTSKNFQTSDDLPTGAPSERGYAACYFPWVEVPDPETNQSKLVPPGGHVAGVIARTDGARGVHKAPGNEALNGINGLQRDVTEAEQEGLNPRGINCLRTFRGRGPLVYGARTTATANPLWKYVNVRRLFLYLEESLQEGTQWAVFEPNNEQLWARVRRSVSNFLTDVWRDGALMGETPEEAFFVKAGRSTMTQNEIDNGKLVIEVGVAPTKPAEFVVFEITQWTSGAEGV